MIRNVSVGVGGGYEVAVGPGLLQACGARLRAVTGPCRAAVIADSNVGALYLRTVRESLLEAGFTPCTLSFPAGERSKSLKTLSYLLEGLAANRLTRGDLVVALGGGVTGDLAGFAAGVYLRGVRFAQLPTTLLAAVDSSVGGKTAVDLEAGKNLAGVFHQPCAVICDTDALRTLPEAEMANGAAEAVKTGVLSGEALFSQLEAGLGADLAGVIAGCVAYKAQIVQQDEFETGPRKLLNLGHTAGHAIEKLSGYGIPHGSAVAMGTALIARASYRLGLCSRDCALRIERALAQNGLPIAAPYGAQAMAQAAQSDKKRAADAVTLVLVRAVGDCILQKTPLDRLESVFAAGMETL